jgi:hypothetical protein
VSSHREDRDAPSGGPPPVEVGDLIGYRDDGGALNLAVAYMDYPAFLPDGSYDPKDGFHVAYFSDHPGDSIRRADARSAIEDLRQLTWFISPFRDDLRNNHFTARSRAAVDDVLARVPPSEFLTCIAGEPCPQAGRWIMRGTDRDIELAAGELLPRHRYFATHPPLWTRWDLPRR